MRILQNTLYVTSPEAYLALDGENILVLKDEREAARVPLHNLEGVVSFGYTGASPALMGACAKRNIALSFLSANGRFLARVTGEQKGNVKLNIASRRMRSGPCRLLNVLLKLSYTIRAGCWKGRPGITG